MPKNPTPEGYSTVCPYLIVKDAEKQMTFLQEVFNGKLKECIRNADGSVAHAEVRIGDSIIMLGQESEQFPAYTNSNYVYVENADEAYKKGIALGGTGIMEPADRFYGNREGGFKDPFGNSWWIAQQLEALTEEEIQKRMEGLG